ncbi:pteridine reductase [Methyloversatilis sp. XJ19-13]|uniref:pteridine reductase n=1 Tax=Methyloversatilis sp. XJ19-13 TaxID=2963430 RepID=UPI00211CEE0E|nr:pteridine reductase [Methyloversatilis sp. XJ19-13]MCQ9373712.1 pteridine reductase [Methyloversatilis sp. XJ19-13]
MNHERVVLITGAARRVGAQTARTLHGAGWRVVIHHHRSTGEAHALVESLNALRPGSAAGLAADLLDTDGLPPLVTAATALWGRLDALVNNASSFFPTQIGSMTAQDWDSLVGSNFKAPLFLAQAAAPELRARGGCIVNIADIHAERPLAGYALYSASKGALATLTRALAIELAPQVRVNGVAPGPIQWPDDPLFDATERARIVEHTLLKREGCPQDIARTVRFLIEDAPYITGQIIAVDGGRSAHL